MMYDITVVVPVYNVGELLLKCVESLINQTIEASYEVILIDDGSTDDSGQLCDRLQELANYISIIHHGENRGLGAARNTGIINAKGKYICFVDADDSVAPDYLKLLYHAISTGADFAVCGYYRVEHNKGHNSIVEKPGFENRYYGYAETIFNLHTHSLMFTVWNKMYSTHIASQVLFNSYKRLEDIDFNYRYLMQSTMCNVIQDIQYYYQVYGKDRATLSSVYRDGFWYDECIPIFLLGIKLCNYLEIHDGSNDAINGIKACMESHLFSSLGGIILNRATYRSYNTTKRIVRDFCSRNIKWNSHMTNNLLNRLIYYFVKQQHYSCLVILAIIYRTKRRLLS